MSRWRSSSNGGGVHPWTAWLQHIGRPAARGPAEILVLAHGQCLHCCIADGAALHVESHGTYGTLDELVALLGRWPAGAFGKRYGQLDVFVGCDLAPCMVLSCEGTLALRPAEWEVLATTALMPWPEEAATFALRFSGLPADRRRVGCFMPKALIGALHALARTLRRELARCEPLPALAVALAQARMGAPAEPPAQAIHLVLGGLRQCVELDAQLAPLTIHALAPDACADAGAHACTQQTGAACLRVDLDRALATAGLSQAARQPDAVPATP